jgi:hypothetical protein
MRSWTITLACSLLLGFAGAAHADDAAAPGAATAEEAASQPEKAAAEEAASPPEEAPSEEAEAAPEEAAAEEAEPGFFARYGNDVRNTFLAGVNGLITWPADPVMLAVRPTDEMRSMPGGVVTGPVTGFFAGTLLGIYRLATGALDVTLCPLSFFPMFSPEPRYQVIPGWEHEG